MPYLSPLNHVVGRSMTNLAMNAESGSDQKEFPKGGATKIGLHSVKNILGDKRQLSLFSEHTVIELSEKYGVKLENNIDRFGVNLNDTQLSIMEGLLRGFTQTGYQGNAPPIDKNEIAKAKYQSTPLPPAYKYIAKIPRLIATQAQILEWSGFKRNSIAEKERAVEALKYLGTTQFCFYYERLALDEKGTPKRSKEGGWIKEEVTTIDALFTIKEIRDNNKKLQYYEILPSPIFLDQCEGYFMLVPYNWREEVQKAIGKRESPLISHGFCFF